jgi:hypothetical protein
MAKSEPRLARVSSRSWAPVRLLSITGTQLRESVPLGADSTAPAREVLGSYHGTVIADGYEPCQTVARAGPDGVPRYKLGFCWAHVSRKYVKAEASAPACAEIIDLIGKLYEIERDPLETAERRGEDPATYLQRPAAAAIAAPGTVTLPTAAE